MHKEMAAFSAFRQFCENRFLFYEKYVNMWLTKCWAVEPDSPGAELGETHSKIWRNAFMMKYLQKLGKALMLPVAALPVCGILMGIGYAFAPAVMGAEGAVEILYSKEIKAIEDPAKRAEIAEAKKKEYNDLFCNPYNAASYGYIDDVIEPRNTRFRVIRALEALADKKQENPYKKHDNLPL